jgi:hypothetical protein
VHVDGVGAALVVLGAQARRLGVRGGGGGRRGRGRRGLGAQRGERRERHGGALVVEGRQEANTGAAASVEKQRASKANDASGGRSGPPLLLAACSAACAAPCHAWRDEDAQMARRSEAAAERSADAGAGETMPSQHSAAGERRASEARTQLQNAAQRSERRARTRHLAL